MAAEIRDTKDRLIIHRAYGSRRTDAINTMLKTSVPILEAAAPTPEFRRGKAGARGGFEMRTFAAHIAYNPVS